ncbi:MAG TPA: sulfotransferase [Candidatus Binataceae bacterium]|nr:sulfotransferase [Candidatus Binataceae bacterium]
MSAESWSRPLLNFDLRAWRGLRRRNPSSLGWQLELRCYVAGGMLSALGAIQQALYRGALQKLELRPPLFLVGHWRSGTTLLHELLALDSNFLTPSTYACFNPQHFLLTRHAAASSARGMLRPTGDIEVRPDSPQEEEFALLCLGALSPYEAFLFPAALSQVAELSDPGRFKPAQARRWDQTMTWILKAIAYAGGAHRQLLLKSPPHSFRIARLRRLFEGARFVRIVREPGAVFASTLRLWESMWQRYALSPPPAREVLIDELLKIGLDLDRTMGEELDRLPAHDVATVRYEALVTDPYRTIGALYAQLRLKEPAGLRPRIEAYLLRHPTPARLAQSSDHPPWRARVESEWAALYERYQYGRA